MKDAQTVDVRQVLRDWEKATGHIFPAEVHDHYSAPERSQAQLWTCTACGFGRFEPSISGTQAFYETIEADSYYNAEKWEFSRAIRELSRRKPRRVLDMGCGSGHFLRLARAAFPDLDLVGSELNPQLLAELADEGFGTIAGDRLGSGEHNASFDAICLFQVLEHVQDPIGLLALCRRLLKAEGVLVVSTPDASGPISNFTASLTEVPPHHVTRWTPTAFRQALGRLDFNVQAVDTEPLPAILWNSYLPVQWEAGIWPARLAQVVFGPEDAALKLGFGIDLLQKTGLTELNGVPGHTVLVVAEKLS